MNIASLNERIIIEKNAAVVDDVGNHMNEWTKYYSCSTLAAASGYQQSEQEKAGVIVGENGLVFTVRYCSETANLDATHYRVIFHGDRYNITSIDMVNYGRKSVRISCERERLQ